ncbi:MAG: hypothetical protein P8Z40_14615 [Chloroflexota bacterium]
MSVNEFELKDERAGLRARLARQMGMVVLAFVLGAMGLCAVVASVAVVVNPFERASDLVLPVAAVSIAVPLAALGLLAGALYKLIPLYAQYRQARRQDEDLFP